MYTDAFRAAHLQWYSIKKKKTVTAVVFHSVTFVSHSKPLLTLQCSSSVSERCPGPVSWCHWMLVTAYRREKIAYYLPSAFNMPLFHSVACSLQPTAHAQTHKRTKTHINAHAATNENAYKLSSRLQAFPPCCLSSSAALWHSALTCH